MATIAENNLRAVDVLKDEKHLAHALSFSPARQMLLKRFGFDVWAMPVCEGCEGFAYWDKEGTATCLKCGHHTKKPITVQEFYEKGHYVDKTIHPGTHIYVDREKVRKSQIATVYGGEAGLKDKNRAILVARS